MTSVKPATEFRCRLSGAPLDNVFIDLGVSPLANLFLKPEDVDLVEKFYPLKVYISAESLLVQVPEVVQASSIFSDYPYLSSYSDSWLTHARTYARMMIERNALGPQSQVVELASNDGYLLQYFNMEGIPVLGVEPAANIAKVAEQQGIPTLVRFFGLDAAQEILSSGKPADLIVANNVLAHVPDLHDFVAGMKVLLGRNGTISVEFPHIARLIKENQFDTIYHEHFSYFSFLTAERAFNSHGLVVFDVEQLTTHGGSLRLFVCHDGESTKPISSRVIELRKWESQHGLDRLETYLHFAPKVEATKRALLKFLISAKENGKSIVGYGAPAKANTLLNYCGIRKDFIDYTVDRNAYKQGKVTPGARIPIFPPEKIRETKPDFLLIFPWNLKEEIMTQNAFIRDWGGQFVVPIPEVQIF